MKILLYNPDNGVTRNFMPHLWMFLLRALTPPGHEVISIDGNAQPLDEAGIARYVREQGIELVGIGVMTRMIAKAYRMADAVRAVGVRVVMGGPHVTELADEEVRIGWASSYSSEAIASAVEGVNHKPLAYRINILISRLCFRGIYFPQMGRFAWLKAIVENRRTIFKLICEGFAGGLHAATPAIAAQSVAERRD